MLTIDLFGRRPSKAQLKREVMQGMRNHNTTWVEVQWGENCIQVEKVSGYGWDGRGWIGKVGGYDLAQEIGKELACK